MVSLVFGGTGKVGSAAIRRLSEKGRNVRVFTRSPEKVLRLNGVEAFIGDLDKPETIPPALVGVDEVLLILQVHPNEETRGMAIVRAIKSSQVERIVMVSLVQGSWTDGIAFFKSKIPIENAIKQLGIDWSIIRAASYFQTDAGLKADIFEKGLYTAPIGSTGVNRIDTRDVGYAMAEAVTQTPFHVREVRIFGPETLTSESITATFARLLGKPIRYAGDDLDAWAEYKKTAFNPWSLEALRNMYAYVQQTGMIPKPGEPKPSILPEKMVHFDTYAQELVSSWQK